MLAPVMEGHGLQFLFLISSCFYKNQSEGKVDI